MHLPPKRFDDPDHPTYDNIRHYRWFGKLGTRRAKLQWLAVGYNYIREKMPQQKAADEVNVDSRELRDYVAFRDGVSRGASANEQQAMNEAYHLYCNELGKISIRKAIALQAPLWGLNPRHVQELWEVDPTFYPTDYKI